MNEFSPPPKPFDVANGMCAFFLQVDNIREALKDLEGKIRPLNPEPKASSHTHCVLYCTELATVLLNLDSEMNTFVRNW